MRITKILTAILSLALMLSLFACGDKPEETTTKTPENTTNTESATTLPETDKTTEPITTDETTEAVTTEKITVAETTEATTEKVTVIETEATEKETEVVTTETETETETETVTTETETVTETVTTETETITETVTTETETVSTEIETESETESEDVTTETEIEETTRFDYFGADMDEYVSLESGALESIELEISSEYLIDENDVKEYVDEMRLDFRSPLNNGAQVTDQAIKYGDSAYIYYHGTIGGEAFDGGSNWDESMPEELVIGMGYFIEELENQLIGIVPSSTSKEAPAKINVTFPEDYWEESFAGAEAVFDVWVVYIVQYELPEYNADFILGELEYETEEGCTDVVSEFEASVLEELKAYAAEMEELEKESALWDYLFDAITVINYPESEVDYYYDQLILQLEDYRVYYEEFGMAFESFDEFAIAFLGLEEGADWQAFLMEESVYPSVKQHLVIHKVAEELNIVITDDDYQATIDYFVENSGLSSDEVVSEFGEYMIWENALYFKVSELLLEIATVSYV